MKDLKQENVKGLFDYREGNLYWSSNNKKAGCLDKVNKYVQIRINGCLYRAHRLIFLYHHGFTPKIIDHIDGNRSNNKIENLRECSKPENQRNSKLPINNTSGTKGVCWHKSNKCWTASIRAGGRPIYLGSFKDKWKAIICIEMERNNLHGKFTNHG